MIFRVLEVDEHVDIAEEDDDGEYDAHDYEEGVCHVLSFSSSSSSSL